MNEGIDMTKERDRGEWIPWYCEDSPGWVELSFAARGVAEGIARKMGRSRGEIHLGSRGLRGLCKLLHGQWEEFEPAMAELLAEGPDGEPPRLVLSEDQRVLIDPDHETRRRPTSAERVKKHRAKSEPPPPPEDVTHVTVTSVTSVSETPVTGAGVTSPLLSSDLISSSEADQDHLAGGSSPETAPPWFAGVVEAVGMATLVDLRPADCWLRYHGHRAGKGKRVDPNDARYWLTTVMVPEARKEAKEAARQRERDKRYADHTPKYEKPTAGQTSKFQAELARRLAEEAKKGAA
jgi:hypothetical protein